MLQCVAVCCSVLQCVAVCCSVLQCVAVCCSVSQCVAVCCSVLQCVVVCCSVYFQECAREQDFDLQNRTSQKLVNINTLYSDWSSWLTFQNVHKSGNLICKMEFLKSWCT